MNSDALLGLIGDLYSQIAQQAQRIKHLEAERDDLMRLASPATHDSARDDG